MLEFFTNPSFMPHGFCLKWQPGLLWVHVASDTLIALAYFSIPAMIVYYLRKRTQISDIPNIYLLVGGLFACFIVFCGITHVLGMVTIWKPWYGLQGVSKLATAVISVATALAMIPILPRALTLRTAEELELINDELKAEVVQRKQREHELATTNQELRDQIAARARAEESEQLAVQEKSSLEQTLRDLRAAQARLVESEKLASLGKSMAGIAHEVNTPVGIAITSVSTLAADLEAISKLVESKTLTEADLKRFLLLVDQVTTLSTSSLDRAAKLLRSVKQVATDQSNDEVRELNLHDYLTLVLDSIKPKFFASKREVKLECLPDIVAVCPPGVISQIVTNLIINSLVHAYDATDEGPIHVSVEKKDKEIILTCEDWGKGIESSIQSKIFEPFFTTKSADGGSGIGLDLVRSLVSEKLAGTIELNSELGKGSQFVVRFPVKNK
ncbi:MAG: sensor histidine kinase [Oceanococcus sp.]